MTCDLGELDWNCTLDDHCWCDATHCCFCELELPKKEERPFKNISDAQLDDIIRKCDAALNALKNFQNAIKLVDPSQLVVSIKAQED